MAQALAARKRLRAERARILAAREAAARIAAESQEPLPAETLVQVELPVLEETQLLPAPATRRWGFAAALAAAFAAICGVVYLGAKKADAPARSPVVSAKIQQKATASRLSYTLTPPAEE
jgi:hypothetical protein